MAYLEPINWPIIARCPVCKETKEYGPEGQELDDAVRCLTCGTPVEVEQ